MQKKWVKPAILIGIFLIGVFIILGACKRRFPLSFEKRADFIAKRLIDKLDLNDKQAEKVNQIKKEMIARHKEKLGERKEIMEMIIEEVKKDSIDQEKIYEEIIKREEKMKQMLKFHISKFADFHQILTKEQRIKLTERMREFMRKHN